MSARDARAGSTRNRPGSKPARGGRAPGARTSAAGRGSGGGRGGTAVDDRTAGVSPAASRVERVIVGHVPTAARVSGALLVLAGLAGTIAPFLTYLVVGGRMISMATGVGSALVALFVPVVNAALGVMLVRGRVPKLGLAYAGVGGALSVGTLLIELYRGSATTSRPALEVLAGTQVLTSSVDIRAGWVIGVVALALTVLAGGCALLAWGRTVMEDGGNLDPVRSALAGSGALLGVGTVLCLTLPAADRPDRIVTDPTTGMQTVVQQQGPQALLDRPGLALLGGLLLAGAVVLCSVIAPSLRPRLAAVGGLLAIAVGVLSAALGGLRDALGSAGLQWTVPGEGLLVAGLGYLGLTVLAWRLRRGAVVEPRP